MVDWGRVQELRSKGWDWKDIATDPKVDFHPDASAGSPARALRALYHRTGHRAAQLASKEAAPKRLTKEQTESRWTLLRIGFLLLPTFAVWTTLAYVAPSPVGLLLPAIPWLALALAAAAFILGYALLRRTDGRRWTPTYRSTVVGGVVLGLVAAGSIGLAGTVVFGCPYLPPASSLNSVAGGWETGPIAAWHDSGKPIVFFYGATWCPYCSASSWAIWKALTEFGSVSNAPPDHSSSTDVYPGTPEVVLENIVLGPKHGYAAAVSLQVVEDTTGISQHYAGTSTCAQQAFVSAYASGIPFLVVNGNYVHLTSLVNPGQLAPWNQANDPGTGGTSAVRGSLINETGTPWTVLQGPTWWLMTYIAKALGYTATTVSTLANWYQWSSADQTAVTQYLQ